MPTHAEKAYGKFLRVALSKSPDEAEAYAQRLNTVLEGSWAGKTQITPVDAASIVESFMPRSVKFSEIAEEYMSLRDIDQKAASVAVSTFISLAGDRNVADYHREDAKLFAHHLTLKGNKTSTVRRRIFSVYLKIEASATRTLRNR